MFIVFGVQVQFRSLVFEFKFVGVVQSQGFLLFGVRKCNLLKRFRFFGSWLRGSFIFFGIILFVFLCIGEGVVKRVIRLYCWVCLFKVIKSLECFFVIFGIQVVYMWDCFQFLDVWVGLLERFRGFLERGYLFWREDCSILRFLLLFFRFFCIFIYIFIDIFILFSVYQVILIKLVCYFFYCQFLVEFVRIFTVVCYGLEFFI